MNEQKHSWGSSHAGCSSLCGSSYLPYSPNAFRVILSVNMYIESSLIIITSSRSQKLVCAMVTQHLARVHARVAFLAPSAVAAFFLALVALSHRASPWACRLRRRPRPPDELPPQSDARHQQRCGIRNLNRGPVHKECHAWQRVSASRTHTAKVLYWLASGMCCRSESHVGLLAIPVAATLRHGHFAAGLMGLHIRRQRLLTVRSPIRCPARPGARGLAQESSHG